METKRITIYTGNHYVEWIQDQVWFLEKVLREHNFVVTVSEQLSVDDLNLVIENFEPTASRHILNFCQTHNKKIGVVLTEHIDFIDDKVLFNGKPESVYDEYQKNRAVRLIGLLALSEVTYGYLTLGDYPKLVGFNNIVDNAQIFRLPYPHIKREFGFEISKSPQYDFLFTGTVTSYRESIIDALRSISNCSTAKFGNTETDRKDLLGTARFSLNIPQRPDWLWTSPMRVLFGFRSGRVTVHIGEKDDCKLKDFILYIPEANIERIKDLIGRNEIGLFKRIMNQYTLFVGSDDNYSFPMSAFESWMIADAVLPQEHTI